MVDFYNVYSDNTFVATLSAQNKLKKNIRYYPFNFNKLTLSHKCLSFYYITGLTHLR